MKYCRIMMTFIIAIVLILSLGRVINGCANPGPEAAEPTPDVRLEKAITLFKKGSVREAARELHMLEKLLPSNHTLHFYLGRVNIMLKNYSRALEHLRKASSLKDDVGDYYYWTAVAMTYLLNQSDHSAQNVKRVFELMKLAKKSVALVPSNIEARKMLMLYYYLLPQPLGDKKKALAQAVEIRKLDAAMGDVAYGYLAEHDGETEKASHLFDGAIAKAKDNWQVFFEAGRFFQRFKKNEKAYAALSRAAKLAPEQYEVSLLLGKAAVLLNHADKMETGKKALLRYLSQYPESPEAHFFLGKVYAGSGDAKNARKHLLKAVELKPDYKEAKDEIKALGGDN